MGAAEHTAIAFDAVADDGAATVITPRREPVNGAFEGVEDVTLSRDGHLNRLVIFVTANLADRHDRLLTLVWLVATRTGREQTDFS